MAPRRAKLIAKTKKVIRVSKSEAFYINHKYMGDEPVFTGPLTQSDIAIACNWYGAMSTVSEARDFLKTYLKNQNRAAEVKLLARISDTWVPTTAAWLARLVSQGYELPEGSRDWLEANLKRALSHAPSEAAEPVQSAPKASIQDRMRERAHDIVGEIEAKLDEGDTNFSLYNWLKENEIPAAYCAAIVQRYTPWLIELCDALEGNDPQLKEAYRHLTKRKLNDRMEFINSMLEDIDRYTEVAKKTKKPRKARPISVEKVLKNFKYQKEDPDFKIASINPTKILGAQELWVFNTKYKYISVFRAIDRAGLSVNRTSITNYDEKTSCTKRSGRKSAELVQKIMTGGKLALRKVMDEAGNDCNMAHRINENTILLRVVV